MSLLVLCDQPQFRPPQTSGFFSSDLSRFSRSQVTSFLNPYKPYRRGLHLHSLVTGTLLRSNPAYFAGEAHQPKSAQPGSWAGLPEHDLTTAPCGSHRCVPGTGSTPHPGILSFPKSPLTTLTLPGMLPLGFPTHISVNPTCRGFTYFRLRAPAALVGRSGAGGAEDTHS